MTVDVSFERMSLREKRKTQKTLKKARAKFRHRKMSLASTIFRAGDLVKLSEDIRVENATGGHWFIEDVKLMIVSIDPDWIQVLIAGKLYKTLPHNISKFHLCPIGK